MKVRDDVFNTARPSSSRDYTPATVTISQDMISAQHAWASQLPRVACHGTSTYGLHSRRPPGETEHGELKPLQSGPRIQDPPRMNE